MPWRCESCEVEVRDDASCPGCGGSKSAWTVVVDQTRALVVSRRARLVCLRGDAVEPSPQGGPDPAAATLSPAEVAPVVPAEWARGVLAAGEVPGNAHLLTVRIAPRKPEDTTITLAVDFAAQGLVEFPATGAPSGAPDEREARFLLVHGPGAADLPVVSDLQVIDLSEEEGGFAPAVEVSGAGRGPVELPTEPVEPPPRVRLVQLLDLEDVCFHHGSAVLLPAGPEEEQADEGQGAIAGLLALRTVLRYLERFGDKRLLIAGHTDSSGSDAFNAALSLDRARGVRAVLLGEREAWVELSVARHEVEDWQAILAWLARARGWDTDPGGVDGVAGPLSAGALDRFRAAYRAEHGPLSAKGDAPTPADWGAFFACYEHELARLLERPTAELAPLRAGVRWVEPGVVGCGERWPIEAVGVDGYRSATNRRVELLVFDPVEAPTLDCHAGGGCDAAQCPLYGGDRYRVERLPLDVDDYVPPDALALFVELPDDAALPTDLRLRLAPQGREPQELGWSDGLVEEGRRTFRFLGLAARTPCSLLARRGEQEWVLWDEQLLDDPGRPLAWRTSLAQLAQPGGGGEPDELVPGEALPNDPRADAARRGARDPFRTGGTPA